MKPVVRARWGSRVPLKDKLTRIVSPGSHGCANDLRHVKRLQEMTVVFINFQDCGLEVGRRIRLNEYASLTGIDIMMHVDHAHVTVVCKQPDALIKADSKQFTALCQV